MTLLWSHQWTLSEAALQYQNTEYFIHPIINGKIQYQLSVSALELEAGCTESLAQLEHWTMLSLITDTAL